jgi:protein phosphatase 2C
MEDACAAVPPFADVPVRMLASARKLDALGPVGVDASAAMHLFGVYDGHGGSEVANYCGDRIHVALSRAAAARGLSGSGELGGIQELWEKAFCECFQRVDDEVSGEASRFMFADGVGEARCEPVAAHDVGSTAVVTLVCSSHVIVANCGDSRVVLCRGKEPMALSVDHKVRTQSSAAR